MNLPGLNFQLGEDVDTLRNVVREFAQAEIVPSAAAEGKNNQLSMGLCQTTGALGVPGQVNGDAKLYEIRAGTSEIQRMLIGPELFAETV
jgi:hypothetical protein